VFAREVDLLLSVTPERPRRDHAQALEPGASVVLYADGLAERRGSSLDDGTELLRTTATRLARAGLTLDRLCDTLLAELGGALDDDVALLAVRAHPEDRRGPGSRTVGATGRPAGPLTDGHPARAGDQSWKSVLTLSSSHSSASARAVPSTRR
jgi:hypothetical protein